jgi:hypothetical protein
MYLKFTHVFYTIQSTFFHAVPCFMGAGAIAYCFIG